MALLFSVAKPKLLTVCALDGWAIIAVQFTVAVPRLLTALLDGWAIIAVQFTVAIPQLRTVCPLDGWAIIAMPFPVAVPRSFASRVAVNRGSIVTMQHPLVPPFFMVAASYIPGNRGSIIAVSETTNPPLFCAIVPSTLNCRPVRPVKVTVYIEVHHCTVGKLNTFAIFLAVNLMGECHPAEFVVSATTMPPFTCAIWTLNCRPVGPVVVTVYVEVNHCTVPELNTFAFLGLSVRGDCHFDNPFC
jgi:hypothetical protein